jgi:hypothetical protein
LNILRTPAWPIAAVFLAFAAESAEQQPDRRVALVIGNSEYQYIARLSNPTNDAALMASTLKSLGFSLVGGGSQKDLDKPALDRAVQAFGQAAEGATVALFYYAGHGVQVRGANYLVPITANPTKEADVDFQMVDMGLVLRQLESAGAKLNVIILDACRNNPFGGRGLRSTSSGLAQMQAPEGTLIAYATQPGNVAQDGAGGNSPFTAALAATLTQPGLDIFRVFNAVGIEVKRSTGGQQQPWIASSPIDGYFYFNPNTAPASSAVLATNAPSEPLKVKTLTEAEMRSAFFGNTLTGGNPNGSSWNVYISPNGTAHIRGKAPNGNLMDDTGFITIENGSWCNTWKRIGRGEKNCTFIERHGDKFVNKNVEGTVNSSYVVRPGNPDNL